MRYTLTLRDVDAKTLQDHLNGSSNEHGAYLFCKLSITGSETRLLVQEVVPVLNEDVLSSSPDHLSIRSQSYARAIKLAKQRAAVFGFVHSHPGGPRRFSSQDDSEEPDLFRLAHARVPQAVHVSLVLSNQTDLVGRVWLPDGSTVPLERIRVIGDRWRYCFAENDDDFDPQVFDRQILAFGPAVQSLLSRLHVGVVGAGGTGSAVCEQLIRLGVGTLTICDPDNLDKTNVNRVYGSSLADHGVNKTQIQHQSADTIGLGTTINPIPQSITFRSVAEQLRACDVVFGCTDDQWGRSILTRFSLYYLVPVIDMGVLIDSDDAHIRSIHGRVTILQAGYACLFCRERISAARVSAESIWATDPARAEELVKEGYLDGLEHRAPAVVSFTTSVAAAAVAELLERLIGYRGDDPRSSELILRFDADMLGRNSRTARAGCFCANKDLFGAGDKKLFLGITWRSDT